MSAMTEVERIMLAALHSRDGHALRHTHGELVSAILAALAAAGYKVLAREPTDVMRGASWGTDGGSLSQRAWRAMFDAAPPTTEQKE